MSTSDGNLSKEEFLLRFEYQFQDAQIFAYVVLLPFFLALIFFPTIGGFIQRQTYVFYGFVFASVLIAWNFGFMGYRLNWIEGAKREDCFFSFEGLEVNICFCELYQTFQEDIDIEETAREGELSRLVVQPAAVLSNLAFIASGITCLFIASYPLKRINRKSWIHLFVANIRDNGNPMSRENSQVALAYGLVVIFIGPASMIFHASLTLWAGIIDVVGILIWVSFCIAYSASQLFFHNTELHRDEHTFDTMSLFIVLFLFLSTFATCWYIGNGQQSTPLYVVYFLGLVSLEYIVQSYERKQMPYNGVKRDKKWLLCAVGSIVLAIVVWAPSGGVSNAWCPSYWPHAVWHIFAAGSTFFLFLYYCSEVDLQEIKQGRVRARSIRTKRLQDEAGYDFGEEVRKVLEARGIPTRSRASQSSDPIMNLNDTIEVN